jgi:hypothetical protein
VTRTGKVAAISSGIIVLAAVAFLALGNKAGIPLVGGLLEDPLECVLSGREPRSETVAARPTVAIKVTNDGNAYPLSGLEEAEIVFEELIEGGSTRFMAVYHCTDAEKVGPVRSARAVDPAIMTPMARILGYSGQNAPVLAALEASNIVRVTEDTPGEAIARFPRTGYSFEHTLYASTREVRKIGREHHNEPPPGATFEFGALPDEGSRRATAVVIDFSGNTSVRYDWQDGKWLRSEGGRPMITELGTQIGVDNVLIEEHRITLSSIVDSAGNPSVEIADPIGSGRAMLLRDGRSFRGRWSRESVESAVRFTTRGGDEMVLAPGTTWVALVPSDSGDVKGSFSVERD